MIPKKLHFIWIGDESKRPDDCIETWVEHHPDWDIDLWGLNALTERPWINGAHMSKMFDQDPNSVVDMMRWEILYAEGGIIIDANSLCLRPLDDELREFEAFAVWENEHARPGLIASGYFGSRPHNALIGQIITDIQQATSLESDTPWIPVGRQRLIDTAKAYAYEDLKILPSYCFLPEHFTGVRHDGTGPVYGRHLWPALSMPGEIPELAQMQAAPGTPLPVEPRPAAATSRNDNRIVEPRENLIILRAGDASLHPAWMGAPERNWDIAICYYGQNLDRYKDQYDIFFHSPGGSKWPGIKAFIDAHQQLVASYKYVWFPDDDLFITAEEINKFFIVCDVMNLTVAQPALTPYSHYTWDVTVQQPGALARTTDFVEIMAPCIRGEYLDLFSPTFTENSSGYGYEWLWQAIAAQQGILNFGIVDATPVYHTRPVGSAGSGGATRSPHQEMADLFAKYGLSQTRPQVFKVIAA